MHYIENQTAQPLSRPGAPGNSKRKRKMNIYKFTALQTPAFRTSLTLALIARRKNENMMTLPDIIEIPDLEEAAK
jgi:hypothetical protein